MNPVAALIVAAGKGERFGADTPKVFVPFNGEPLFLAALRPFDSCRRVDRLIVAVADEHCTHARNLCENAQLSKPWTVITGGARRQDTVSAGLQFLSENPPRIIAIHDGARPLIDTDTITRSVELANRHGACITANPVTDTIKQVGDGDDRTIIGDTLDRSRLWRAQTPQTFQFELLTDCYDRARKQKWQVTDDASVVERCGHEVHICPANGQNPKITVRDDLTAAEALAAADSLNDAESHTTRVGTGYDVHALAPDTKLIIGGVKIPHETGLAGHSDADVLMHATCDAVLGAAGEGDIGKLFPNTDPKFEDNESSFFCRRVAKLIADRGYQIVNIDATIIAERPKLADYIPKMRFNLASAFSVENSQINVKATTTEGLGFAGRAEGIAAHAVATIQSTQDT